MSSVALGVESRHTMRRQAVSSIACLVLIAAAMKTGWLQAVPSIAQLTAPAAASGAPAALQLADLGVDIIRMPPGLPPSASTLPPSDTPLAPVGPGTGPGTGPRGIAQPQGRLLKVPVRLGSQPSEAHKAWLGVNTDPLDLPLAISLGRTGTDGALVTEAAATSPAGQAGIRFGDIIVGFNDKPIGHMNELRQQVATAAPGVQVLLQVWRVTTDDGDFLHTLRRLAGGGNAHVMYRLGRMYAAGSGVARDDSEAVSWYRKSADAGNLNAMAALAVALLEGRGAAKDQPEAVRLLRLASGKDGVEANYRLGVLMVQGRGVDKDVLEGMRLLTRASDTGHTPAMVDLGVMHNHGIGVQVDFGKAAQWYKRAADLGSIAGMVSLGYLYQQGKGVEQNDFAAAKLYRRAADLGSPHGIHNLAAMLDRGKGVERRDPEQAAELVLQAIEMGNQFSYQQMAKNAHSWSAEFRRALQKKLRDAGTFTGRIDGTIGASTITALDAYISRHQRRVDPQVAHGTGGRSL
jgi:TPR repeat protein